MHRPRHLLLALCAGLCLLAGSSGARADVANWHQGMTFASWWHDAYLKSSTITSLNQLVNLKGNWIAIVPHWYMSNRSSTTIYAENGGGTASDESVRHIIQQAHARGLKVMLKPHVDPRDGAWRGSISPSSASAWFSSYRNFILHYARMATELGVEMFCVGCEYKSMSGSSYTSYWRSIVADVRNVYKGPLTYAANWGPKSWGEYYMVQWWDALDYIGVDAYFPITRANNPTVEQAKAGWYSYTDSYGQTNRWVDDMKALSQKFGKKVIFTELGFNTVRNPGAEWEVQSGTDQTGAKNCVEATFQVFDKEPWMAGIFWWTWNVDPNRGGANDRGMDINNKPMAQVIADWYGRGGGDTTPPSTPSGLTAQPLGTSSIALKWNAATDNVGVTGYRVYRNGTRITQTANTSHTDTGLAAGTQYSYRVSAIDAAGNESTQSAAVTTTTASPSDTQKPSTPTGLTASTTSATEITVRWNASTDNVGVAGYRLYRNNLEVATVNTTTYKDSGLTAGTTYTYQVAAFDAAGNRSDLSAPVAGTTAKATDATKYDFEDGTQGWENLEGCVKLWNTTDFKYEGFRSIGLYANAISSSSPGYARVRPPASLGAGATVTANVYVDSSKNMVTGRAYIQDATGKWVAAGPITSIGSRTWTRLTVTVPATAQTPLMNLGLQFMTSTSTFTGSIYVDDVRWDGVITDPGEGGGSGGGSSEALRYGFESGTQGWTVLERCTKIWNADYVAAEGNRSLGFWLDGASASTPGYVLVKPDASLVGGCTITVPIRGGSDASNVVARLYIQDATRKWVAMSPVTQLTSGWTNLKLEVPTGVALPLQTLGVQIMTNSGTYSGSIHIDGVRW